MLVYYMYVYKLGGPEATIMIAVHFQTENMKERIRMCIVLSINIILHGEAI